ncbi:MAG: ABC transporter substrate-binding protein [Ilumatobacteraceae bacterium]
MRISRKRGRLAFVAITAFALFVAACGGSSSTSTDETVAPTDTETVTTEGTPAKPFEGVTLRFGKAPHGEDEKANWEKWLPEFTAQTGINVELTQVPWDQLEALYTTNFASDTPFDVTYQTSTHLTLFGERGAFEDLTPYINGEDFASDLPNFPEGVMNASTFNGKLYGLPFVVGTIAMYANLDMLASAGVEVPTTQQGLLDAAAAVVKNEKSKGNKDVWGFYTPTTVADYGWYFNLQNVHNFGGDFLSVDGKTAMMDSAEVVAATNYAVDLVCSAKVQPPIGRYNREAAIELFKAGKLAFILDEPSRVATFEKETLPFKWDIYMPVGSNDGKATQFATTGHWSISTKSANKEAAWEFVKWLSSAEFNSTYNERYGFVPARLDADASGGNEKLARNASWVAVWDGLRTSPKVSQMLDEYAKALEAATSCKTSVEKALKSAQERATEILAQG